MFHEYNNLEVGNEKTKRKPVYFETWKHNEVVKFVDNIVLLQRMKFAIQVLAVPIRHWSPIAIDKPAKCEVCF